MSNKPIYFPGLNGLRAIAALAVVISHTTMALNDFNLDSTIFGALEDGRPKGINLASYGVSIFFVLSGFLITYLLLAEKKVQEIDIKKFYVRRLLRIWPLYYLYFIIALLVLYYLGQELKLNTLLLYIFFAANVPYIIDTKLLFLDHYWSLGVEEQFYLFWPWLVKKINKYLIPVILILIILLFGAKVFFHLFFPNSIIEKAIHITRFHAMLLGALGAILFMNGNKLFLKIMDNKIVQFLCWGVIVLLAINKFHVASLINQEIVCVVALALIIGQIKVKNRVVNLEKNIFDYLGKISYGIYVIHPLIIFFLSFLFVKIEIYTPLNYFLVYVSVIGLTIFIADISYRYFEKYFMNLKKKFVVVESSPTRNTE